MMISIESKAKNSRRSASLRVTLALGFVILSVVSVLLVGGFQAVRNFQVQQEVVSNRQKIIGANAANQVSGFIEQIFNELETSAQVDNPFSGPVEEQPLTLEHLIALQPAIREVVLLDTQGQELAKRSRVSVVTELTNQSASEMFSQITQNQRYISSVQIDEITSEPLVTMAIPIRDAFGDFHGGLVAKVNLKFMWDLVDKIQVGQTGQAYVVDERGQLIAFGDTSRVLAGEVLSDVTEVQEFLSNNNSDAEEAAKETAAIGPGINGNTVLGTHVPLGSPNWAVVVEMPRAEAYQEVTRLTLITGGIILVVSVLAAMAGVYLSRRLSTPLLNLTETATRIAAGDLESQALVTTEDEIGQLGQAFNHMTSQLRQTLKGLENRTRGLELAAEVGQFLSTMRDLDTLLPEAVELIRSNFDLYYVQIYLTNPSGRAVVLRAGSGSVGEQLVRRGHRLPVGPGSINGTAAAEKRAVIVADTAESETFLPNPVLPDTRSEMAVPLIVGEHVVGVLNLQHNEPNILNEEFLSTFEALAGQLAIAIDNANLFAAVEQARIQTETYARRLTGRGWEEYLNAVDRSERLGYAYDAESVHQLEEALPAEGLDEHTLAVPVAVGGKTIGTLQLESEEGRTWADDEAELVTVVGKQVAQQVENLRLLAQAEQYRAEAEAAVRRTTREGWQAYIDTLTATKTGFSYDLNEVTPVTVPVNSHEPALVRPITVYGEPIGELAIAETDELDDETTELLAIVAEQLSEHIEKARLTEETEKALNQTEDQAARLAALNKMSEELSRADEINDIFKIIAEEIGGIIEGDRTSLALLDETDNEFEMYALNGDMEIHPTGTRLPFEGTVLGKAIQENTLINTPDTRQGEMIDNRNLAEHGLYSTLVAPLASGQKVIGTLNLVRKEAHAFTGRDEELIRQVASLMASIIERKRAEEKIQQNYQAQSTLNELLQIPLEDYSMEEVLDNALDTITTISWLPTLPKGGIFLAEPGSKMLELKVHRNLDSALQSMCALVPFGHCLCGRAAESGQLQFASCIDDRHDIQYEGMNPHGHYNIPIMAGGDQVLGAMVLYLNHGHERNEDEVAFLEAVARALAGIIQRKQAEEEIQKSNRALEAQSHELEARTRELEASQQVTFAATEHSNPDELLNLVVNLIRDQFDLYHAQVYLVDQKQQVAVLKESTGYAGRQLLKRQHRIPLDSPSLVTRAIKTSEPILVADVSQDETWLPNELLPHTQAELVVPLKVGEQAVGALDVQSRTTNQLTPRSVTLFQTMTDQVAFLFENSELLSHVSEQTASLTRFTSQLRTAAEVTERLNTILDPDILLDEVVAMLQNRFSLYHVHIYLLDTDEEGLALRAGSGELGKVMRERGHKIPFDHEHSLVARAARNQEIVMAKDVSREPNFMPNPLLPDTRSEVAIPLVASSGLLGILDMQDSRPNRFEQTDLDTFSALAGQVATALENARLFEETQQTAQRLRQVDRMKSEFLANMSHELRTPLNSIIGYSEMMLMGISGDLPEEVTEDVQAIYDNGKHLLHVISDILDLAKIEAGRLNLQFEGISVGTLLDEIKVNNAGLFINKPVELIVEAEEDLPEFQADPIRLNQIFNNLISNAAKFTPEGHVAVRAFRDGDWIAFEIEDTGVGISEEDLKEVFEKFMQVDGSFTRRAEGTGLGLAITRHLIHLHGGEITLRSQVDVGTTFTIRLPLEQSQAHAKEQMVYEMTTAIPTNGTN